MMGNIFSRKRELKNKIEATDKLEENNELSIDERYQRYLLKSQLAKIISKEEIYRWQRSRDQWIKNEDRNTNFFSYMCQQ